MSENQLKRKLEDETISSLGQKKPHNEHEITFSNVVAESTHVEDEENSTFDEDMLKNIEGVLSESEEEIEETLAETIVSATSSHSENYNMLANMIGTLKDIIKVKEGENASLMKECENR